MPRQETPPLCGRSFFLCRDLKMMKKFLLSDKGFAFRESFFCDTMIAGFVYVQN